MEVLTKEYAGRTVQLRYNNPLGSVDNEGTLGRHVGDVSEEYILLDGLEIHVLFVVTAQTKLGLQRNAVGQATLHTLRDGVARRVDEVVEELKVKNAPRVGDGEVFLEYPVQTFQSPIFGRRFQLEKFLEGFELDF